MDPGREVLEKVNVIKIGSRKMNIEREDHFRCLLLTLSGVLAKLDQVTNP